MKTLSLLTLIAASALAGLLRAAAQLPPVESAGRDLIELMVKRDFASAVEHFDATMKTALPSSKLAEVWQTIQKQSGPFQKQLQAQLEKEEAYDVVLITCQFQHALLDAKVVFDGEGQVAGLFFLPSHGIRSGSALPGYVKTNAFREKPVTVGTGEWRLPGTLTMPRQSGGRLCPAVVLVHGSGPQDRDETIGPNKPLRDLAGGLATRGIAVVRYEKRTKQYGLKMVAKPITVKEETIDDALSAVAGLRKTEGIDPKRVFVLGHSLGGMLAPRIGAADSEIAGLIIMAANTRPLEDLILEQTRYLLMLEGKMSAEKEAKLAKLQAEILAVKKLTPTDKANPGLLLDAPAVYWLDLRSYDPVATAKNLRMPIMILQGQRDYQVSMADFEGWRRGLGNAPNVVYKLFPKLNHLFQSGEGKSTPAEYQTGGYIAEEVIKDIADWVQKH